MQRTEFAETWNRTGPRSSRLRIFVPSHTIYDATGGKGICRGFPCLNAHAEQERFQLSRIGNCTGIKKPGQLKQTRQQRCTSKIWIHLCRYSFSKILRQSHLLDNPVNIMRIPTSESWVKNQSDKHGKKLPCNTENDVPIVVPGLSSGSSRSSTAAPPTTSSSQGSSTRSPVHRASQQGRSLARKHPSRDLEKKMSTILTRRNLWHDLLARQGECPDHRSDGESIAASSEATGPSEPRHPDPLPVSGSGNHNVFTHFP